MSNKRIVLIGATGNFGSHLARNLARVPGLELVLTSRDEAKAKQVTGTLGSSHVTGTRLDRNRSLKEQLAGLKPWLVVDASGPFQGADYSVALAAMDVGAHYMDIADGRDFLSGFAVAIQQKALSNGLTALSGVSSTPALSGAAVAALTLDWQRVDTIDIAITPDGTGHVGEAAAAGVLSYAGCDVPQFRFGTLTTARGWMGSTRLSIPGLGWRRVAPVETVDAELLSGRFNVRSRVAFYAGLESPLEMRGLALLARLRSSGVVKSLTKFAKPLASARAVTRPLSGKSGGMLVRVAGLNKSGHWTEAGWSLLAKKGQGLNVPGLPVVAAVRMLLGGELEPGASVVCGEIPLEGIEREFQTLAITSEKTSTSATKSGFARALPEEAVARLPAVIRDFHDGTLAPVWTGRADVRRGAHPLAKLAARIIGLPPAGLDVPVRVTVERETNGTERWTRNFAGRAFHSILALGQVGKIWERFGAMNFRLDLHEQNGQLHFPISAGRCLGLPVPRFLLPTSKTVEFVDDGDRFNFDVELELPLAGLLVHYRGWLEPVR